MRCLLLVAAQLACAGGAPFGPRGALVGRTRRHHSQRIATWRHLDDIVVTLRGGGGDGVEANPEYAGGKGGDASDADSDSSDDGEVEAHLSDGEDEGGESTDTSDVELQSSDSNEHTAISKSKHHHRSKSRKTGKSGKGSVNKSFISFAKGHQLHFYVLLAIIAFRRDIAFYALRILPTKIDPETGARKLNIRWSTDVLKLVVLGALAYRFLLPARGDRSLSYDEEEGTGGNHTQPIEPSPRPRPILPLLLLLSLFLLPSIRHNLGMFAYFFLPLIVRMLSGESDPDSPLSRMMLMFGRGEGDLATRMAYLPPLEQHYAFEQLNERYYRDWGAWRKAVPTNAMVTANEESKSGSVGVSSMASSLVGRRRSMSSQMQKTQSVPKYRSYPSKYNNGTVIVVDMTKLDTKASRMETIRDQISFVVRLVQTEDPSFFSQKSNNPPANATNHTAAKTVTSANNTSNALQSTASPTVEVIVLLESPGGGVSEYGLAASHLQRLRDCTPNVQLTVCIDTVAASGGYMMACMSSPGQLYCAPFAMVGSIGVIGQSLNIQKTLEGYGVRPYVFRGGKMKNPVGMVGDVTKEGVVAMQDTIDRIHDAFREHVLSGRREAFAEAMLSEDAYPKPAGSYFQMGGSDPSASIEQVMDEVATGDVYLGAQALKLGLVDRLITSDEYIAERIRQGARVLKLVNYDRRHSGLSGLLAPHQHRPPSLGADATSDGFVSFLKKLILRASLVLGTDDGLASSTLPRVSAAANDFVVE